MGQLYICIELVHIKLTLVIHGGLEFRIPIWNFACKELTWNTNCSPPVRYPQHIVLECRCHIPSNINTRYKYKRTACVWVLSAIIDRDDVRNSIIMDTACLQQSVDHHRRSEGCIT